MMRFDSIGFGRSTALEPANDDDDGFAETEEEAREYDERIRQEIQWKVQAGRATTETKDDYEDEFRDGLEVGHDKTAGDGSTTVPTVLPDSEPGAQWTEAAPGGNAQSEATRGDDPFPAPSFRPSNIQHSTPNVRSAMLAGPPSSTDRSLAAPDLAVPTPTLVEGADAFPAPSFRPSNMVHSTPKLNTGSDTTSTFPQVPTPTFISTPQLPRPPTSETSDRAGPSKVMVAETPVHVPSPIDTPSTATGEGRGRRDDPATPVPLGVEKFKFLKGKKDFQTLTKHFEVFTKQTERQQKKLAEEASKGKGKGRMRDMATLGGKVFEGLRFCFPPELGNTSKQKTHWDIIAKRGGQVTLQPDTAITHVIYDSGRSAQALARQLGLETLSELPEGTVCVRYDWVVHCLRAARLVDTGPYLSFPKNVFTRSISTSANVNARTSSRMTDITDLLRGKSVSISRKRGPTASDSETESPAKMPRGGQGPLRPLPIPDRQGSRVKRNKSDWANLLPSVHTSHDAPKGPGWLDVAADERDGLDDMISGLKEGSLEEDEAEADVLLQKEVANEEQGPGSSPVLKRNDSNPSRFADHYKCGQTHDGSPSEGPNDWLAKKFDEMHDLYQGAQHKNTFQVRGYQKAAGVMRRTKWPITSGKDALKIKGIGQSMADRIDEWITGGQGRQYYETNDQVKTVQLFKDVYGVGRTRANEFYHKGARTIDDLKSGRFDLTEGQRIGLALYDDLKQRIPRAECKELYDIIHAEAIAIDPKLELEIMGSYRRGSADSGDVDFLFTRDDSDGVTHAGVIYRLIQRLLEKGIITHELSAPHDWHALEAKWMGVCRLNANAVHRRIDILCIPFEQWGAALLYFTGNDIFNRSLRLYARKMGYSLNQRGLYKDVIRGKDGLKLTEGEIIASRTEQEIFDVLGIRWRAPHHRRP